MLIGNFFILLTDDDRDSTLHDVARKEMGLEWMLKPANQVERIPKHADDTPEDLQVEEVMHTFWYLRYIAYWICLYCKISSCDFVGLCVTYMNPLCFSYYLLQ